MSLLDTVKRRLQVDSTDDEVYYLKVVKELESGYKREGLWAKALAETDGDSDAAHAKYIRLRVLSLKSEPLKSKEVVSPSQNSNARSTGGDSNKEEFSWWKVIFGLYFLALCAFYGIIFLIKLVRWLKDGTPFNPFSILD